jgi:hypothetical protein
VKRWPRVSVREFSRAALHMKINIELFRTIAHNSALMGTPTDLITVSEAQEFLEVSHRKMADLIKAGAFTVYRNPLDKREKLVSRAELEAFKQPFRVEAA